MNKESYNNGQWDTGLEYVKKAWPELNVLKCLKIGDWQGTVYVVGYVNGKVLACGYGYGSCSGCGAWGEGGEPTTPDDLIHAGKFGETQEETLKWIADESQDCYQHLIASDKAELSAEVRRAFSLIQ